MEELAQVRIGKVTKRGRIREKGPFEGSKRGMLNDIAGEKELLAVLF